MKRFLESVWAVWCVVLIVTAFGLGVSKVDWPGWRDAFWSSWAQTIGALGAIFAAFQVGRSQVRAAATLRRQELADEHRLALTMVIQGIHEAMGLIDAIARHPEYQGSKPLRMSALESLAAAERLLIDGLRMKMPKGCRSKVWEAKSAIHANLLSMTIAKGPYTDGELVLIDDQLAKLNSLGAFMATVGDTIGSGN